MITQVYNLGAINLKMSPLQIIDGDLLRAVNVERNQVGAYDKRPGYSTYQGTSNGSSVDNLYFWEREDGTRFAYKNAGGKLYHSIEGTGAWTISGNGTVANGHMGFGVLEDTLVVSQGSGTTRHSINGTSFTDTDLAPAGDDVFKAGRRLYINGTSSTTFWSTTNDPTNWSTSGTSDSSSQIIPGAGKLAYGLEANNRAVFGKEGGRMYTWDDYTLRKVPTNRGFTSRNSLGEIEEYFIGINRTGLYGYGGNRPEILSNYIEQLIYNNDDTGIDGSEFDTAPGFVYRNKYYCSVGDATDSVTGITISNCVLVYDFQLNEWVAWSLAHKPTAWMVIKDTNDDEKLVFGISSGQCYQFNGTDKSDSGSAIEMIIEGVLNFKRPGQAKYFKQLVAFSSPGTQAKVQIAVGDTFTKDGKQWSDLGDLLEGVAKVHPPDRSRRGNLMFFKFVEKSNNSRPTIFGFEVEFDPIGKGGK